MDDQPGIGILQKEMGIDPDEVASRKAPSR